MKSLEFALRLTDLQEEAETNISAGPFFSVKTQELLQWQKYREDSQCFDYSAEFLSHSEETYYIILQKKTECLA